MKILNLYSGIGGNRRLWGNEHEITAVEYNTQIAHIYHDLYPSDNIIIADAHQYLLMHHNEYDFIWSSPPCQTHSSFRHNICVKFRGTEAKYADCSLYEEIIFLTHYAKCNWVVENVKPYYKPMCEPKKIGRHLFWSNFEIPNIEFEGEKIRNAQISDLEQYHNTDLSKYKISNKRQILRNCVTAEMGLHILNCIG